MICQQSGTEFHFPDLDKQLCLIQQMFEKRDRSKSNASEHQQLPSADAALRPLTLNTGLSFSYPVQFQSHVENIRNKRSFFCSHFAGCHATSSPSRVFRFALGRELEIAPNTLVSALASQPLFLTYLFLTELLSEI